MFRGALAWAVTHYEIHEHRRIRNRPASHPLVAVLNETSEPLEEAGGYSELLKRERGTVAYGAWGAGASLTFLSKEQNNVLRVYIHVQIYRAIREQGFEYFISRSALPVGPIFYQMFGGGSPFLTEFKRKGNILNVFLVTIHFHS